MENYRFVISFNLGLILLGVAGIITPVDVGAAAQQLDTGDQLKEHDEPAAGGRAGRGIKMRPA